MKTIVLIFSYEELNTNVLFNSVLHNARKDQEFKYVAYVPIGYKSLFFCADEIIEIPKKINSFTSYSEVSEYGVTKEGEQIELKERIKFKLRKVVFFFLNWVPIKDKKLIAILSTTKTPRQSKYLYDSHVMKWVKSDAKKRFQKNYVVVPVQNHIELKNASVKFQSPSLTESFRYLFKEHEKAIKGGLRIKKDAVVNSKKVFLRTRNYSYKQPNHNTSPDDVLEITKSLIASGINVINIGSPALSVGQYLDSTEIGRYQEFSNVLNLDEEITLIDAPVICRADAGLFVLIAMLPLPIICLTKEWSEFLDVSLINAREASGWNKDLVYGEKITSEFRKNKIINLTE